MFRLGDFGNNFIRYDEPQSIGSAEQSYVAGVAKIDDDTAVRNDD